MRLHAQYYNQYWGFDVSFEIQVASESAKFFEEFDADRDGFWAVVRDQRFVGSIAVDGQAEDGARIRWFILEPDHHGQGLGGLLIDSALQFCRERNLNTIFLWTFKGLDSAARLYTNRGFKLEIEHEVAQWGRPHYGAKIRIEYFVTHPSIRQESNIYFDNWPSGVYLREKSHCLRLHLSSLIYLLITVYRYLTGLSALLGNRFFGLRAGLGVNSRHRFRYGLS